MEQQPQGAAQPQKKIPIEFPSQLKGGVYANNMMVMHTREEFIWTSSWSVPTPALSLRESS
jgi:hypothetical protein